MRAATDILVRVAGGDPGVVALLADAFRRALRGRMQLEMERREGAGLDPDMLPALAGTLLGMASVGLAALVAVLRENAAFAALLLAGPCLLLALAIATQVGAFSVLEDDDSRTLGWWPVSRRNLVLARLLVAMKPVLQASAVLTGLPLAAFAVLGPVPVVSALGLALGLLLQAFAASLGVTVGLLALRLKLGRERARRAFVAAAIAGGLVLALGPGLAGLLVEKTQGPIASVADLPPLDWLPPAWFAAWGLLPSEPARALPLVAGSGALALLLVPLALRGLAREGSVEALSPQESRPRRAPFVAMTTAWLVPFTPGREGWCVRRLLAAHLRDDWQRATFGPWPVLFAGAACAAALVPAPLLAGLATPSPVLPVRGSIAFVLAAAWLPIAAVMALACSRDDKAAWLLRQADLAPARLLAAVRGVARGLLLAPLLIVLAVAHARAGTAWGLAASDLVLATLLFETSALVAQRVVPDLPFSRSWQTPPQELALALAAGAVPVSAILAMVVGLLHEPTWIGRVATWLALAGAWAALRRR